MLSYRKNTCSPNQNAIEYMHFFFIIHITHNIQMENIVYLLATCISIVYVQIVNTNKNKTKKMESNGNMFALSFVVIIYD